MNKKKWTWVLIVIVSGLWVYNIYNTVKTFQHEGPGIIEENNFLTDFSIDFQKDTFLLILPNRDPFLDKNFQSEFVNQYSTETAQKPKNELPINSAPLIDIKKEWPKIKYYGFVKNRSQNHLLCVVGIDKKIHKLSIGDTNGELKVLSATIDSVQISFNGEIRNFQK